MKIEITHPFKTTAHDLKSLFDNTNRLSTFMKKLENQSTKDPDRYDPKKYLGDGWEFLMEIFIKSRETDERIGISNYQIVKNVDDTGVDAIGINISGDKCVIQHKYKANTQTFLTANKDHLSNMFSAAQTKYGVSTIQAELEILKNNLDEKAFNKKLKKLEKSAKRHYIFTTAKGLHYYTDGEMFSGDVVVFGYKQMKAMLDNNLSFWNLCRELISEKTKL